MEPEPPSTLPAVAAGVGLALGALLLWREVIPAAWLAPLMLNNLPAGERLPRLIAEHHDQLAYVWLNRAPVLLLCALTMTLLYFAVTLTVKIISLRQELPATSPENFELQHYGLDSPPLRHWEALLWCCNDYDREQLAADIAYFNLPLTVRPSPSALEDGLD